jgi:HTH-type transcriptional repressor of NAD biosynthesis genes
MTKRFHRGLIVGKFSPLHRGHELAIQRVIDECEEAIVLSYTNPEFTGCGPNERRRWLRTLFPAARVLVLGQGEHGLRIPPNDADDATHRRFVAEVCRKVLRCTADAVFTSEHYGDGFAEELTHYFRELDPSHAAVQHVQVDLKRESCPVSGTQVRRDVHACRAWLSPVVHASFVKRVCLLGGESTGKSTLAAALAERFWTRHAAEYGRELWEERGGELAFEDLVRIARTQMDREEALAGTADRWLFCDTSPLTTLLYSLEMFGRAAPELIHHSHRPYAAHFLCAPVFEFVQDGTRRDAAFRLQQHQWYVRELNGRGIHWHLLSGSAAERMETVAKVLAGLR